MLCKHYKIECTHYYVTTMYVATWTDRVVKVNNVQCIISKDGNAKRIVNDTAANVLARYSSLPQGYDIGSSIICNSTALVRHMTAIYYKPIRMPMYWHSN